MGKFEDLDKITNIVCKPTPTLTVKHIIKLTRPDPSDSKKTYGYAFEYNNSYGNKSSTGLYFNSVAYIQLSGKRYVTTSDNRTLLKEIKCDIQQQSLMAFMISLDNAYNWLAGNMYSTTFILDANNRPLKISDPLLKETCPLTQLSYIAFKPAIIRDSSDVRYEGIAMGTQDGEITNFTALEFATFREQMRGLIPNLYTASCVLVNQAMTYSLYEQLLKNKR